MSKVIARTKVKKIDGEYVVQAFDENGKRMQEADYYTSDREDANQTAARMCPPKTHVCRVEFMQLGSNKSDLVMKLTAEDIDLMRSAFRELYNRSHRVDVQERAEQFFRLMELVEKEFCK